MFLCPSPTRPWAPTRPHLFASGGTSSRVLAAPPTAPSGGDLQPVGPAYVRRAGTAGSSGPTGNFRGASSRRGRSPSQRVYGIQNFTDGTSRTRSRSPSETSTGLRQRDLDVRLQRVDPVRLLRHVRATAPHPRRRARQGMAFNACRSPCATWPFQVRRRLQRPRRGPTGPHGCMTTYPLQHRLRRLGDQRQEVDPLQQHRLMATMAPFRNANSYHPGGVNMGIVRRLASGSSRTTVKPAHLHGPWAHAANGEVISADAY